MIKKIDHTLLGTAYHTWLQSLFHFSYADSSQPYINHFGVIRVINDDILHANAGHDLHKHRDVEIITYLMQGELTHTTKSSFPTKLNRGQFYYMSAGKGIEHAEFNWGDEPVRMIQLWIKPTKKNLDPKVIYNQFENQDRYNKWQQIISGMSDKTEMVQIQQDINIWVSEVNSNKELTFDIFKNRQAYLIQLEGESMINNIHMIEKDGMEIFEQSIHISTLTPSFFMLIEMPMTNH